MSIINKSIFLVGVGISVAACSASKTTLSTDLNAALDVGLAAESAYAASQGANPKVVAQLHSLLAAAQAAVSTWSTSNRAADEVTANAAISALVAYEATLPPRT